MMRWNGSAISSVMQRRRCPPLQIIPHPDLNFG
jgi:hypothetical protein